MAALITIDNCNAEQLVGTETAHLSTGQLNIYPAGDPTENKDINLTLGPSAAFHLSPSTSTFFTHASNTRIYLISLPLGESIGSGSYVQITLPEGIDVPGSEAEKARDTFEEILVSRGFLKEGVEAAGDELGRGIAEGAAGISSSIKARTSQHISSTDAATSPTRLSFSPTTHSFIDSTSSATQTAAGYTTSAAKALANVSISFGEKVAGLVGITTSPTKTTLRIGEEETREDSAWTTREEEEDLQQTSESSGAWDKTKNTVSSVGAGISEGAASISATSASSAHDAIQHSYGNEAAGLAGTAGDAVKNVGTIGLDVLASTSAIVQGAAAVHGASNANDGTSPPAKEEGAVIAGQIDQDEKSAEAPTEKKEDGMTDVPL